MKRRKCNSSFLKKNRMYLMNAAKSGDKERMRKLIAAGANVNASDGSGKTALMYAAVNGHADCIPILADAGANLDAVDEIKDTALIQAIEERQVKSVEELIRAGADMNKKGRLGMTALTTAAVHSNVECLDLLIKGGSNVNYTEIFVGTPLIMAAKTGNYKSVDMLLRAGADVNARNKKGSTALFCAMLKCGCKEFLTKIQVPFVKENHSHKKCAALLLEAGADVNLCSNNGISPLTAAAFVSHPTSIPLLIKAGAHVNACDEFGRSVLLATVLHLRKAKVNRLVWEHNVELLIEAGADANGKDTDGMTTLMYALMDGLYGCVSKLLKAGTGDRAKGTPLIDINAADSDGNTAVLYAAKNGNLKCLDAVINAGANVNKIGIANLSAVHHAAVDGNFACVKRLLRAGAGVNFVNDYGHNALAMVILRNMPGVRDKMSMLLYAAGAMLHGREILIEHLGVTVPVPGFLLKKKKKRNLKERCREVIRKYMVALNHVENLFVGIPKLEGRVSSAMRKYLLYDIDL